MIIKIKKYNVVWTCKDTAKNYTPDIFINIFSTIDGRGVGHFLTASKNLSLVSVVFVLGNS